MASLGKRFFSGEFLNAWETPPPSQNLMSQLRKSEIVKIFTIGLRQPSGGLWCGELTTYHGQPFNQHPPHGL
jgi:hypothetical protein